MKGPLYLAWCYLRFYRARTVLIVACFTLTMVLPLTLFLLVETFDERFVARAEQFPLLLGARGSETDLVLRCLYHGDQPIRPVDWQHVTALREQQLAEVIPIYREFSAAGYPIIGTSIEYFSNRGLVPAIGSLPLRIGDVVLGAHVAKERQLRPGDWLDSDPQSAFNLAAYYPLRLRVRGVLAETETPDDRAIFVDVKTSWILAGIGHGHVALPEKSAQPHVTKEGDELVANLSLPQHTTITEENIGSFHFHGSWAQYPLSGILLLPRDTKARTLLKGRYHQSKELQLLEPMNVITQLMKIILQLRQLYTSMLLVTGMATCILIYLVIRLSVRLRAGEFATMERMGVARTTIAGLVAIEYLLCGVVGILAALSIGWLASRFADELLHWLIRFS